MENSNTSFIFSTSQDYCIDYEIVERIYRIYGNSTEFYEKLEEIVKNR